MGSATKLTGTPDLKIESAILFVSRSNIRPIIRQELKTFGITQVYNPDNLKACLEDLAMHEKAFFILDLEHGLDDVNTLLRAAKGHFRVDTRPIFLISSKIDRALVGIGAEYHVSRVHAGEISKRTLGEALRAIVAEETGVGSLRSDLMSAAAHRARGDHKGANAILQRLHDEYADDRRITCDLADGLIMEGKWDEAQVMLEQMSVLDTTNLRARHLLARCLMHKRKFRDASEHLKDCKLLNPYNIDRLVDLGHALMGVGEIKDALSNFEQALSIDRSSHEASLGKGQCLLMEGDVNDALKLLREVASHRELASIFNNAAILSIHQGRFESGLQLYHSAIGAIGLADAARARLMFNLGLAFHKWNRLKEAFDCFKKAEKADPTFTKAAHNAAVVKAQMAAGVQASATPPPGTSAGASSTMHEDFSEDFEDEKIGGD